MRIKSKGRRHSLYSRRTLDNRLHYPLMPKMQPVKNAQRQYRRAEDVCILSAVKYFHTLRNADTLVRIFLKNYSPKYLSGTK